MRSHTLSSHLALWTSYFLIIRYAYCVKNEYSADITTSVGSSEILEEDLNIGQFQDTIQIPLCFVSNEEHDLKLSKRIHYAALSNSNVLEILEKDLEFILRENVGRVHKWFDVLLESRLAYLYVDPEHYPERLSAALHYVEDCQTQVLVEFKTFLAARLKKISQRDLPSFSSIIERIVLQLADSLSKKPVLVDHKGQLSRMQRSQNPKPNAPIKSRPQHPTRKSISSSAPSPLSPPEAKADQVGKSCLKPGGCPNMPIVIAASNPETSESASISTESSGGARRLRRSGLRPTPDTISSGTGANDLVVYELAFGSTTLIGIVSYFLSILQTAAASLFRHTVHPRSTTAVMMFCSRFIVLSFVCVRNLYAHLFIQTSFFLLDRQLRRKPHKMVLPRDFVVRRKQLARSWNSRFEVESGQLPKSADMHLKEMAQLIFPGLVLCDESVHRLSSAVCCCVAEESRQTINRLFRQVRASNSKFRDHLCEMLKSDIDYVLSRHKGQEWNPSYFIEKMSTVSSAFAIWNNYGVGFVICHYRYLNDRLRFYLDRISSEADDQVERQALNTFLKKVQVAASKTLVKLLQDHLSSFADLLVTNRAGLRNQLSDIQRLRMPPASPNSAQRRRRDGRK